MRILNFFVGAAAAIPSFPSAWSSDNYRSSLLLFQGGDHNDETEIACCALDAPQCKVQSQVIEGSFYVDGTNNRTSLVIGQQALINLYEDQKQVTAELGSDNTWQCKSYCPLDDPFDNPLQFDPKAKNLGKKMIDGKEYTHWQWFDKLLWIKMDEQDWYVDDSGAQPVPFRNVEKLTPFNKGEIAFSTADFDGYSSKAPDASVFTVSGLANCEVSENCQQPSFAAAKPQTLKQHCQHHLKDKKIQEPRIVETKAKSQGAKWPVDWSAVETQNLEINQGATPSKDGKSLCCSAAGDVSSQCQVQIEYTSSSVYHDFTHNRSRVEQGPQTVVDLYNIHKSLLVAHNGTVEVCQSYCPLDPLDTIGGGAGEFLDDNATDLGTTTYKNQSAHHWEWKEKILRIITMQISDFYAAEGEMYTPLGRVDQIKPFGQHVGDMTLDWSNFQAGPQDPKIFNIQGVDSCPVDPNCGQNFWQAHRLARGQLHTFAEHMLFDLEV